MQLEFDGPVVVLSPGELFGGVETHVLGLCGRLREIGVPVLPVLFHERALAHRLRDAGFTPAILRARHRYDPAAATELAVLLRRHRAAVLHLHGYRAAFTAALAASRWYTPVVKTEHGLPEPETSLGRRARSRLNRALDGWATRRLRAHVCYVTGDLLRRCAAEHAGCDRRVLPNGILPLDRAGRRRPLELEPGAFHAGIVGRLTEVKGISVALRALAAGSVPQRVRLHVIGTGPQEGALRREASALVLDWRVRFHGFRGDAADWMAHLDALLMPSLHEGLPYTLLEAMSLGLPVAASRVGGLPEALRDGETGLLTEPGDAAALGRAVARLAADAELARALGAAAAREQRARFTLARMVDDYLEVYAAAAASGPDARPHPHSPLPADRSARAPSADPGPAPAGPGPSRPGASARNGR